MDGKQRFNLLSDGQKFQRDIRKAGYNTKLIKYQGIARPWCEVSYTLKNKKMKNNGND